jgi:hypothetical protein
LSGKLCCAESKTLSQIQDNRAVLAQQSCQWLPEEEEEEEEEEAMVT